MFFSCSGRGRRAGRCRGLLCTTAIALALVPVSGRAQDVTHSVGSATNPGTITSLTNDGGDYTNDGTITDTAQVNAGIVTNTGTIGSVTGVLPGATFANTDTGVVGSVVTAGTTTNHGVIGTLRVDAGTTTQGGTGSVTGPVSVLGGAFDNAGTTGDVGVASGGAFANAGTAGAVTNSGATVNAGTLASVTSDAGTVTNAGTGVVSGSTALTGGSMVNEGTIGDAAVTGGTLISTGSIVGTLSNAASATIQGILDGVVLTQTGGTTTIDGDLAGIDAIQTDAGGELVQTGGTATLDADATVTNAGTTAIDGGTLAGSGTTAFGNGATGLLSVGVGATLDMGLQNDGTATVAGTVTGAVTNTSGTTLTLSGTIGGALTNTDTGTVTAIGTSAAVAGQVANAGLFTIAPGAILTAGGFDNTGTLAASGASQLVSAFTNASGATLDLQNGSTTDTLTIDGDATLNGTVLFDANLSSVAVGLNPAASVDSVTVSGTLDGAAFLSFGNVATRLSELPSDLTLIDYGTDGGFAYTTDLPTTGAVIYEVRNDTANTQFTLSSSANPAIGGLAGGIALSQSLIGTVVNRPSSALVTPLADPGDDPCAYGAWGRTTGGRADVEGVTTTGFGEFGSSIEASYRGIQAGFDRSCFGGHFGGWDLSLGSSIGVNDGAITQPVFQFDPVTGTIDSGTVTSVNETDLRQVYGAVYMTAARGSFFADLQYRHDVTRYDLENSPQPGFAGLGLDDQTYRSRGNTVSGAVGYAYTLNEDLGLRLVPTGGFSYSRISTDDIDFANGPGAADDGVLEIDDIESRIGFAGMTLARTQVLPGGTAALNYFGTATVYNDFAGTTTSTYFDAASGTGRESESSNLGRFGEVSLGVAYTKILDSGSSLPARQFDASVRLDSQFSDTLDSWGLNAQARLQF